MLATRVWACTLAILLTLSTEAIDAWGTIPYGGAGGPYPGFGPGVILPPAVGGKEFSHDLDYEVLFGGPPHTALDPEQVVAWDGKGGVTNVKDYTKTRLSYPPDDEIDALANHGDYAYNELKKDDAHLLYSLDDSFHYVVPSAAGPGTRNAWSSPLRAQFSVPRPGSRYIAQWKQSRRVRRNFLRTRHRRRSKS